MAGARIGYILTSEEIADTFNQYIQLPYPLSSFSMQLAIEALENIHIVKRSIELIKTERSKIFEKLNKINQIKIFESHSNFFFLQTFNHFDKIRNLMYDEKILIKNFGNLGNYKGAMRITIGSTEMNDKIISVFEKSRLS